LDLTVFDVYNGVEGEVDWTASFDIPYPITIDGFWNQINDAEWRACSYLETEELAQQVLDLEGFTVAFEIGGPREGVEECDPELPDYPYQRRAPAMWTAHQWIAGRIEPLLRSLPFHVEARVLDDQYAEVDADLDLDDLREMQRRGQLFGGAYR
jgi:hypothetical protein